MNDHYPFTLPPLRYACDSLAPYLDTRTLSIHHDTLLQGAVDALNAALARYPQYQNWSLIQLIRDSALLSADIRAAVRHSAGSLYCHSYYFDGMTPPSSQNVPQGALSGAMQHAFGAPSRWRSVLRNASSSVYGSGYVWLCADSEGSVRIVTTQSHDIPHPLEPLLCVDLWEHAYFLSYRERRWEYIENWLLLADWRGASARYQALYANHVPFPMP